MADIIEGSVEFIAVNITSDDTPVLNNVQLALDADQWRDAETLSGKIGYLLDGTEAPGRHTLWARVTDNPEVAILKLGSFVIGKRDGAE